MLLNPEDNNHHDNLGQPNLWPAVTIKNTMLQIMFYWQLLMYVIREIHTKFWLKKSWGQEPDG
jgi:hypothetical protein